MGPDTFEMPCHPRTTLRNELKPNLCSHTLPSHVAWQLTTSDDSKQRTVVLWITPVQSLKKSADLRLATVTVSWTSRDQPWRSMAWTPLEQMTLRCRQNRGNHRPILRWREQSYPTAEHGMGQGVCPGARMAAS